MVNPTRNDAPPKPVRWVGSSKDDLSGFPEEVRRRVGGALWDAQRGLKAPYAKPLRGFGGAGVLEIVDDSEIHIGPSTLCASRELCMCCMLSRRNPNAGEPRRRLNWT